MAEVYAPRKELGIDGENELVKRLKEGITGVHFPLTSNLHWGFAIGYRDVTKGHLSYLYYHQPDIYVFHDVGIAVVNEEMPEKEEKIDALSKLGYRVAKNQLKRVYHDGAPTLAQATGILWEEMRAGFAQARIRENLEALLVPIMTSYRGIKQFEFAVYDPDVVSSSDDVIPEYIEYDEVFPVQADERGAIDFGMLIKRMSQLEERQALALSSRVLTSEGQRHIPMIDFKSYEVYYVNVIRMLQRLNIPFKFLVVSSVGGGTANYHHYYANRLMGDDEFNEYCDMLRKQPEVGEAWADFQAGQGFSLLRVAPSATKLWFPEIIEVTEGDIAEANKAAITK